MSTDSWADLPRDGPRHGMRGPVLDVCDSALGFWAALSEVCPEIRGTEEREHAQAATKIFADTCDAK